MPTDPTPRDADETLALPVTDDAPITAVDGTAVLPTDENGPAAGDTAVLVPDETRPLPVADESDPTRDESEPTLDESEPTLDDTTVLALDEPEPPARTSAWSAQAEPAPSYTSPIGALYTPADRPTPDPVATPAPVVDPAPVTSSRRRLRVGTVVWGLVIAAIGVGLLAWAAGFAIDLQLAMIVLLAVAGTALLVGSIVSGARAARR